MKALTYLVDKISSIETKKNRRDRGNSRETSFEFRVTRDNPTGRDNLTLERFSLRSLILEKFSGVGDKVYCGHLYFGLDGRLDEACLTLTFTQFAAKPGQVPSAECHLSSLGGEAGVWSSVQDCVVKFNAHQIENARKEGIAKTATDTARALAGEAAKAAFLKCRFRARMAGLVAEYKSHLQDEAQELLELLDGGLPGEGGATGDETRVLVRTHFEEFLKEVEDPLPTQGFGYALQARIKPEDLPPKP